VNAGEEGSERVDVVVGAAYEKRLKVSANGSCGLNSESERSSTKLGAGKCQFWNGIAFQLSLSRSLT
jgi:hypothetical protein